MRLIHSVVKCEKPPSKRPRIRSRFKHKRIAIIRLRYYHLESSRGAPVSLFPWNNLLFSPVQSSKNLAVRIFFIRYYRNRYRYKPGKFALVCSPKSKSSFTVFSASFPFKTSVPLLPLNKCPCSPVRPNPWEGLMSLGGYSDFCLLQALGLWFWVQNFEFRYFFGCQGFVSYFLSRYFFFFVCHFPQVFFWCQFINVDFMGFFFFL